MSTLADGIADIDEFKSTGGILGVFCISSGFTIAEKSFAKNAGSTWAIIGIILFIIGWILILQSQNGVVYLGLFIPIAIMTAQIYLYRDYTRVSGTVRRTDD